MPSIAASVDVPVNADFEGGFAIEPEGVAANVAARDGDRDRRALDRGLDRRRRRSPVRVRARGRTRPGRAARDRRQRDGVLLTGRSEGFIVGRPDLAETIRRLTAYAEAGADCLYAPGIPSMADIAAVVERGRPEARQRARRRATSRPSPSSPTPASAGSASAARWRGRRGAASSAPPRRSPSTGRSVAWPTRSRSPRSTERSAGTDRNLLTSSALEGLGGAD